MNAKDVKTISVVGAGFIAPGVALVFAAKKYNVFIYARRPEALTQAITSIRSNLTMMAKRGIFPESEVEPSVARVKTTTDLKEAVKGTQLVIECLSENMELKQKFFQDIDQICAPDAILASNTSVMSITEIASKSKKRDRIVGTHFWNPPYLIPLVEVTKAKDTSDEVMELTYQVMKNAGKHPVKCMKDVPGFIANRLQHALWREAISIVENGIADAATVDEALKNGFAIRLPILGPIENADMVGLDLTLSIHDYIFKHLESSKTPSPLLKEKVQKGELGFKTGKGFQNWTPEQAKLSRERLLDYLIEWTRKQQSEQK
jgi:3-hydroxybutyryl-CoA dehydrogenase